MFSQEFTRSLAGSLGELGPFSGCVTGEGLDSTEIDLKVTLVWGSCQVVRDQFLRNWQSFDYDHSSFLSLQFSALFTLILVQPLFSLS